VSSLNGPPRSSVHTHEPHAESARLVFEIRDQFLNQFDRALCLNYRELDIITQFVKRSGTGGSFARGPAIRSRPARSSVAVEEVRRPFPYRPSDTDKSPLDVLSRFLSRSRMLRAIVDTRCTRLFRQVAVCSYASLFAHYAARAVTRVISSSI
jgi:hypothetical protein